MKKNLLFKIVVILFAVVGFTFAANAQVTTSAMNGIITDSKGALPGASVKATHTPSGTVYLVTTNNDGRFSIGNMRIGGPYTLEVSYIGYAPGKVADIFLKLGEAYTASLKLSDSGTELSEVTVKGVKNKITQEKTGASTNISSRDLASLPTISRSISDFTRLTPQANGNGFGGRDGRYNNIQVDGANLNNNFGLNDSPLPGGGAQPISLDSYDQISVNIAPYDVRQSGFTGANISAVTKSGTNSFHGTAYGYYKDQSFLGTKVGNNDISSTILASEAKTYGFSLGGPIIKNKLFFFINAEKEKSTAPGISYAATGGSGAGTPSSTTKTDLDRVSNYLSQNFGYQTGGFESFPAFASDNHKILAKLDWNINNNNKLTVKYSDFKGTDDQQLNATSVPNGGGFTVSNGTGRTSALSRLPNSRFGARSFSFENSNYGFLNTTRSGTLELNSRISNKLSNQLLLAVTKNQATRDFPGSIFPTIDIFDGAGGNYITAGMDPYTLNNDVVNDVYSFTDNITYYAGKHTLTAGLTYEYQKTGNMFMAPANSYYAYNNIDDFLNNRAPVYYAYTYSLVPGNPAPYSAELKLGQAGAYIQDEYNMSDNVKLTFGLRADMPIYHEDPLNNPTTSKLNFLADDNVTLRNYTTDHWAKSKVMLSPRFGFRFTSDNKSTVLRGGLGVFTGKIPFVYLTNIPTNTGMYQFGGAFNNVRDAAILANIKLNSDPAAYASLFPATAGTTTPANVVFTDDNFKFPKVFRVNLGLDKNLGNGFTATFDGLFTKDINAVRMRNANLVNPNGIINEGGLTRPRIIGTNRINSGVTSAIVLENSDRGYAASLTAQLSKSFSGGFSGSIGYTYSNAQEVTANPGSQASSIWNSNPNVGTSNYEEMGNSAYAIPHRVVGNVSYRFEYLKHLATTISVFYQGQNQGLYSYVVNGDINGDGNSSADLMYIPKPGETNFAAFTIAAAGTTPARTYSVQEQQVAFEEFINNTPYLRKNRGKFAERNAAMLPWFNRFDVKVLQDIFVNTGSNGGRQTLQLSADIFNFANLVNKKWGTYQRTILNNPLAYRSVNAANQPVYNLATVSGELVKQPIQDNVSVTSTYSIQLGLRYIF